jgi:F0F1-type ATP synthase assembly protein I
LPGTVRVRDQKPPQNVQMGQALGLGMTWAGSTALFLYLGSLVDGWLATKPVFTLIGAFVGAAAGFYYLYSQLMAGQRNRDGDKGDREQKP